MNGFGKIDIQTGYLMSSQVQHDSDWLPLDEFSTNDNGEFYEFYLADGTPNIAKIEEAETKKLLDMFTGLVETTLQTAVDNYNTQNNVLFANIHAVANYINTPSYTHYAWCAAAWDWNVQIWEIARQIQFDVMTEQRPVPTPGEFLAELPILNFEG